MTNPGEGRESDLKIIFQIANLNSSLPYYIKCPIFIKNWEKKINMNIGSIQFSSVQSLSRVWLFATPWIPARQASPSITSSWSSLRLKSIESVCHPAISSSGIPFSSCPQSLPASGSFPMSQLFSSGGQSTGVSALASFLVRPYLNTSYNFGQFSLLLHPNHQSW